MLIGYAPGHADIVVPATGDSVRVSIVMHQSALQLSGVQVTATPVGTDPGRDAVDDQLSGTGAGAESRANRRAVARERAWRGGPLQRARGDRTGHPRSSG